MSGIRQVGSVVLALTLALGGWGTGSVRADAADFDPFARPAAPAPAAPAPTDPLANMELAGVSSLGGCVRVCLSDRVTRQSRWLVLGEPADGMLAVAYDRDRDAVRVSAGSSDRWIALRKAAIIELSLPRLEHGAIDWAHVRMSDTEKARDAEAMVTDIMEVAQLGRSGKLKGTR